MYGVSVGAPYRFALTKTRSSVETSQEWYEPRRPSVKREKTTPFCLSFFLALSRDRPGSHETGRCHFLGQRDLHQAPQLHQNEHIQNLSADTLHHSPVLATEAVSKLAAAIVGSIR